MKVDISDKGVFFSVSVIRFFKSPNFQKERFQKTILDLKFKFPSSNTLLLLAGNLNFKFRIVFLDFFLEIWSFKEHMVLSEKKATFNKN